MKKNCFVIVSDDGESWALEGDELHQQEVLSESKTNKLLPQLVADGWKVESVTAGSGSKDDNSYWLVHLREI
jgi:hypothetical protein